MILILDHGGEVQLFQISVGSGATRGLEGVLHARARGQRVDAGRVDWAYDVKTDRASGRQGCRHRSGLRGQHGEFQGGRAVDQPIADSANQGK